MIKILRIGISYERESDYAGVSGPSDRFAEFEPESTIAAMESAIRFAGHIPVRLGPPRALLQTRPEVDVIWNIAEGYGTRNRESWTPVLAELWNIPLLGSDALTLGISLDKALTKDIAALAGIPVTKHWIASKGKIPAGFDLTFPVFVKPRYEGTAKGISARSVCADLASLAAETVRLFQLYQQDILIEPFLPGAEFTCAVGGAPLRVLEVLERALHTGTRVGLHAIEAATGRDEPWMVTHQLPELLEQNIGTWSLQLCERLGVKHWARLDFKLDDAGNPFLLEINPLPTFGVEQTFAILAELKNEPYDAFLGGLLTEALNDTLV